MGILTERQSEILALTRRGLTNAQIAETLQIEASSVYDSKRRALARVIEEEEINIARRVEMERFDELNEAFYDAATGRATIEGEDGKLITLPPDKDAADMILKISDRRAKLFGFNAAEKKEVEHKHSLVGVLKHISGNPEQDGPGPRSREDLILEAESVTVCEGSPESGSGEVAEGRTT